MLQISFFSSANFAGDFNEVHHGQSNTKPLRSTSIANGKIFYMVVFFQVENMAEKRKMNCQTNRAVCLYAVQTLYLSTTKSMDTSVNYGLDPFLPLGRSPAVDVEVNAAPAPPVRTGGLSVVFGATSGLSGNSKRALLIGWVSDRLFRGGDRPTTSHLRHHRIRRHFEIRIGHALAGSRSTNIHIRRPQRRRLSAAILIRSLHRRLPALRPRK